MIEIQAQKGRLEDKFSPMSCRQVVQLLCGQPIELSKTPSHGEVDDEILEG